MKSSSLSILGLTLLLATAPALQANDTENSSWLAPFTRQTFIYPALGLGAAFIAYKLYSNYTQSSDLDVIAPWYEDGRTPEETPIAQEIAPQQKHNVAPKQEHKSITLDILDQELVDIIESCIALFVEAYGPQLVTLHIELANPDLSDEDREQYVAILSQLEQEAPDFAQTVPPLMMNLALLQTVQDTLLEQATSEETNRSTINAEFISLINTIDTLIFYVNTFVEIYGNQSQYNVMDNLNEQLERESYEYAQENID